MTIEAGWSTEPQRSISGFIAAENERPRQAQHDRVTPALLPDSPTSRLVAPDTLPRDARASGNQGAGGSMTNEMAASVTRVGLAGLGRFGQLHAAALAAMPDARLAAICDPNPDALATVGERYGV